MADNRDYPKSIRVPSNQQETLFNDEAMMGAVIGHSIAGDHDKTMGLVGGGLVGGLLGKERIREENLNGKLVHKPASKWLTIGIGAALGALAYLLAPVGASTELVLAIGAVGAAITGFIGYAINKNARNEYDKAKTYFDRHGHYRGAGVEPSLVNQLNPFSISVEESRVLEERQNRARKAPAEYTAKDPQGSVRFP